MSFVLGSSVLGTAALGNDYKKYKAKIFDGTSWKTYKTVIINNLIVPTNAIVDSNDVPILTSDGEFLLVDENTTGLTAEYTYSDPVYYTPYIVKEDVISSVYSSDGGIVYHAANSPIYVKY